MNVKPARSVPNLRSARSNRLAAYALRRLFAPLAVTLLVVVGFAAIGLNSRNHSALARYKASLAVLSPEFLAQPTFDPMSGGQLQYVLRDDGRFTLYSAGKDHRDDGGERPFWFRGKPGLWEELDAVWPEAEAAGLAANPR